MRFHCNACLAEYSVPDEKIRGRRVKTACKQCRAEVVIDGTRLAIPAVPAALPLIPSVAEEEGSDGDVTQIARRTTANRLEDEPTVIGTPSPELIASLRDAGFGAPELGAREEKAPRGSRSSLPMIEPITPSLPVPRRALEPEPQSPPASGRSTRRHRVALALIVLLAVGVTAAWKLGPHSSLPFGSALRLMVMGAGGR